MSGDWRGWLKYVIGSERVLLHDIGVLGDYIEESWVTISGLFHFNSRGIAISGRIYQLMAPSSIAVRWEIWCVVVLSCPIRVTLLFTPVVPPLIRRLGDQYITEYQPIFRPECQPKFVLLPIQSWTTACRIPWLFSASMVLPSGYGASGCCCWFFFRSFRANFSFSP